MGSYEAGAASALRGLGSEPCGASCGYDDCGRPSRAPPMARMALLWGLNPRGPDVSVQACRDRIAQLGSRYRARQRVAAKPARLRFLSNIDIVTETHGLHAIAARQHCLPSHHSSLPGVTR